MSFTDVTEFPQLFSETLARVRARLDADANAGLTDADPEWIDIREGSFYWDCTQPPAMEMARLWDAMTEVVAAAFPATAWGDYLDEHGRTFNLVRVPARVAIGSLTFIAREPTDIAAGTLASSVASQTGEVITVQTIEAGTTCPVLVPPWNVTIVAQQVSGRLSAGVRYYHITALNEFGETTGTPDAEAITTSNTGRNFISWEPVPGAAYYQVYVGLAQASKGGLIGATAGNSFLDDGTIVPQGAEPTINTTSGITLSAAAVTGGESGNIAEGSIQSLDTPIPTVVAVSNRERFLGGTDGESDDDFRGRILTEYIATVGGGNQSDYVRWVTARGIERVSVIPAWAGPGTVLVICMMGDGSPVAPQVVGNLQAWLDPVPGQGAGQAPIGAHVTVSTSTILHIDLTAQVVSETGYTIDGDRGTIATRSAILSALTTYLRSLEPGDVVIYEHIQACFFVPGVLDIGLVTVNGTQGPQYPLGTGITPQVARLGNVVLTERPTPIP